MRGEKQPDLPRSFTLHFGLYGVVALMLSACSGFDREDRIEDLRILAVRADPPEILYSPLYALTTPDTRAPGLPLQGVDMELEVYAFEPRGGLVRTQVNLCPAGEGACIDYDTAPLLADKSSETQAELKAVYTPPVIENAPLSGQNDPSGRIPDLKWQFTFTPAVIDSLVPKTEDGLPSLTFFPTFPRIAVDIESPTHEDVARETAFKRISTGVDLWDPSLPPDFRAGIAGGLGIELCDSSVPDEEFVEGPGTCLEPRVPNRNPTLLGFYLTGEDDEPEEGIRFVPLSEQSSLDVGPRSSIRAARGSSIRLEPVFAEGDDERYQAFRFNIEDSTLEIENRREDFVGNWYSTGGSLSLNLTTVIFYDDLSSVWTLPSTGVEPGDEDTLVAVFLDQRGGTAVGEIRVTYR